MTEPRNFDDVREQVLLQKCAQGDKTAFQALYELTNRKVYAYINRVLQEKADVDDVFVETYSEVWRSAAKFRGQSMVSSWIIGIARNLSMNLLKRERRHEDIDQYPNIAEDRQDAVDEQQRSQMLHHAITELPQIHREVLGLILLPEFSYEQIADLMGIPLNTVKTRVYYAKAALKEKLQAMGISHEY